MIFLIIFSNSNLITCRQITFYRLTLSLRTQKRHLSAGTLDKIVAKSEEKQFQIIFKNFADLFFENVDIDISSEVHTGRGIVDFKFSIGKKYRALIEIKLDSNTNTENGLNYQLPIYLHAENVDIGIFLLVIFKEQTIEKISEYKQMTLQLSEKYKKDFHFYYIDARNNIKSGSTI